MLRSSSIALLFVVTGMVAPSLAQDATTDAGAAPLPAQTSQAAPADTDEPAETAAPEDEGVTEPEQTPAEPVAEPTPPEAPETEPEAPQEQAEAPARTAQSVLETILGGAPLSEDEFSAQFLAAVPMTEIDRIVTQVRQTIGPEISVTEEGNSFLVKTPTHEMKAEIALDGEGKIATLFFHPAVDLSRSLDQLLEDMKGLGGDVAYLVTRDGQTLKEFNAGKSLAVGSTFKLGVLAALLDRIKAGDARWSDVASLEARQVSLPSGLLQTFPVGAPLTLHTLAALMISISDNTATDVLIDAIGRQPVAEKLGTDFVLKTRELFMLKGDEALREKFLAADANGKAEIAAALDGRQISAQGADQPHIQGLEWYLPANRICPLAEAVAGLDVMSISPGPIDASQWQRVAYKGGSETGVLNFTAIVTAKDGPRYCVTFTWNKPEALDETKAAELYASVVRQLAAQQ